MLTLAEAAKGEGEMFEYEVKTEMGVTLCVQAESEGQAWMIGYERIMKAYDRRLLPIVGVEKIESDADAR